MKEIESVKSTDGVTDANSWDYEKVGGDVTDAPDGGWLVLACFHTLWSTGCVKTVLTQY